MEPVANFLQLGFTQVFFVWKNQTDAKFFLSGNITIYIYKNSDHCLLHIAKKRSLISYKLIEVCLSVQPCTFGGKFGKDIHKNS